MRACLIAVLFACFALAGCQLVQDPDKTYVEADAATFDATADEYLEAVVTKYPLDSEDEFVAKQGQRRVNTAASWWRRLESSAENLGIDVAAIKSRLFANLERLGIDAEPFTREAEP